MLKTSRYQLALLRAVSKKDDEDKLFQDLKALGVRIVPSSKKARGWNFRIDTNDWKPIKVDKDEFYSITFKFSCTPKRHREQASIDGEMDELKGQLEKYAPKKGWRVEAIKDKNADRESRYVDVGIPKNWMSNFSHLYNRQDQIGIVLSAIKAGIESNWEKRYHVCLAGPPACAKTDILRSVKNMLGENCVLEYDATATTQAGAIKDLDNRLELPRVMIVEELEKVDEGSLRWMLGVLDYRAEIRKVNFRQSISKSTKMLCLATVNDYGLFKKMMYGALASRFAHHVYCPPPDEKVLKKILTREVEEVDGSMKWVDKALEFCLKHRITDPRKAIAVCLCGKDELLSGQYQKKLEHTMMSKDRIKLARDIAENKSLVQEDD